ncbi:MAG: hypothetical protein PHF84_04780, partial [bacterium]|nr:hypothetical protein [bacterium]
RTWSQSYVFGFLLTIPIHILAYLFHFHHWWIYGLTAFLGFFTHITEDMTGHIGGSLFWPLHKARSEGLELFKASDPRTNFSVMYAAVVLTVWNVDRFSTHMITLPAWSYLAFFLVLPLGLYFFAVRRIKQVIQMKEEKVISSMAGREEPDGMAESVVD